MIVYMFQCYSLKSSHSLLLPLSPKVYSLCLCLFLLCSLNHDCKMTTLPPDKCPVQEEEREKEMVIPLPGKQKLSQKSVRLHFMCPRLERFSWPPLTVRESQRKDISVGHFGTIFSITSKIQSPTWLGRP